MEDCFIAETLHPYSVLFFHDKKSFQDNALLLAAAYGTADARVSPATRVTGLAALTAATVDGRLS